MDSSINLTAEQKALIEKLGVMHEKKGMQPAVARIAALLLIAPQTELTFDQIREALSLSKSAASNALNMLLSSNKVDYITKPGDRKRYFRSKLAFWKDEIKKEFTALKDIAAIFQEILEQRPAETKQFNDTMAEIIDFINFMNDALPGLYKQWESRKT